MVLGLIILILSFGNASIKEISIAGIKLNFAENVSFAYRIIWMIWGYFLYRYFIYFMEEGRRKLRSYWELEFEQTINKYIRKKVYEQYEKPNEGSGFSYYSTKRNNMVYQGQVFVKKLNESTHEEEDTVENISLPLALPIIYLYQVKAFLKFLILRSVVTDYVFVFVFSAVVVAVSEMSNWKGSLSNIFT